MTMTANIHAIKKARVEHFGTFSAVTAESADGNAVTLFLPAGEGQAIADAINAAVRPLTDEVTE